MCVKNVVMRLKDGTKFYIEFPVLCWDLVTLNRHALGKEQVENITINSSNLRAILWFNLFMYNSILLMCSQADHKINERRPYF